MTIKILKMRNIRNHINTQIELSPRLNVFFGDNGSGKTSVLESVSICSMTKSFLGGADSNALKIGADWYGVSAEAVNRFDAQYKVSIKYFPGKKKEISSSYGDNLSAKDIIGVAPTVALSPDFRDITAGSPGARRSFIDKTISQTSKAYIEDMLDFKKCLRNRNALLAQAKKDYYFDATLVEPWTEKLVKLGANISKKRSAFVRNFKPYFLDAYKRVSSGKEDADVRYSPDSLGEDYFDKNPGASEIESRYYEAAQKYSADEIRRGTTLFGPQKDDLTITINGSVAKDIASQGQHKSLLASLKFAEFEYLLTKNAETPIILLDDVFSELDPSRSAKALKLALERGAQTFVAAADVEPIRKVLSSDAECAFFRVNGGNAERTEL